MARDLPDKEILALIPASFAHAHAVVPLSASGAEMQIACSRPLDSSVLHEITFFTGRKASPHVLAHEKFDELLALCYPGVRSDVEDGSPVASPAPSGLGLRRNGTPLCGSVVQCVDGIVGDAILERASDVHIEPYETSLRVRYRLDGVLHTINELGLQQKDEIIARLKIMASLDIAEKRRPQDGRIRVEREGGAVDIRVSTLPTDFGEKVVLRILDKGGLRLELGTLGLSDRELALCRKMIRLPYGMILVTGPTGSGKTTTLYAALNAINSPEVNITTIEDPIEYNLPGINQTHVRGDIGFTFAHALRAFLRQDPDVIMVGEIRDAETAEIAVRAALTGHLVLSTLHTNDAASTVTRLLDMGIEPFLLASSLKLVLAQRLVRCVCPRCRSHVVPDVGIASSLDLPAGQPLYQGKGCDDCNGTGYRGRTALFESMPISEEIAGLVAARTGTSSVRLQAIREGMQTLRQAALEKLLAGVTTAEEVLRETA